MFRRMLLRGALLLACLCIVALLAGCRQDAALGRFGVCAEPSDDLKVLLDKLGDVWYYDYQYISPSADGHARLFMVRWGPFDDRLREVMRQNPGAWWAAGNEPNDPNQDFRSPEEYARFYHDFYQFAKQTDRGCRVVPAGLADADWRWAAEFRDEYRRLYGRFPPLDGWNIHNYLLDERVDPYDVAEFKRRIIAFRHWVAEIGEGDRPLLLTEFGVLYGAGCCERPLDPPAKTVQFMRETVKWLAETDYVQHWAWFIANNAGDFNGGLSREGALTLYGETYRDLIVELSRK